MNFKRIVFIRTKMTSAKILATLNNVTTPWDKENTQHKFEGKIQENKFKLFHLFNYGRQDHIRPEINGVINQYNNYCELEIHFDLSSQMKLLLILTLISNVIVAGLNFKYQFLLPDLSRPVLMHIGFLLLGYVMLILFYSNKVDECKNEFLKLTGGVIRRV